MENKHPKHSKLWHMEEDFNALARLYIRGFVSDSVKDAIKKKMDKKHTEERRHESR